MSALMPEYPAPSPTVLLDVDRAHKAMEKLNDEIDTAVKNAIDAINARYSPISYAAQSVLYEAMGKAAEAGFTREQMHDVMNCDGH